MLLYFAHLEMVNYHSLFPTVVDGLSNCAQETKLTGNVIRNAFHAVHHLYKERRVCMHKDVE